MADTFSDAEKAAMLELGFEFIDEFTEDELRPRYKKSCDAGDLYISFYDDRGEWVWGLFDESAPMLAEIAPGRECKTPQECFEDFKGWSA